MAAVLENPRAVAGNNNPPPIEAMRLHVEDLMDNARQFLDGETIETQVQADGVGALLAMLREANKDAEAQRKSEKEPHLTASREVDGAWKPLTDKIVLAQDVAKKALAPFLEAEQARKNKIAADARKVAEDAAERVRRAIVDANAGNDLAQRERVEDDIKAAAKLDKAANKLEGGRASVAGGARAVSLRTRKYATLIDAAACLKHYREHQPDALKEWLTEQAQRDVNNGALAIPGIIIATEQVAV